MKRGGHREGTTGFTIVEVLIVLTVSSLLLLSAIALVSGRQESTEFTTGINDLEQQLQQIINETASGYFPNSGGFTCLPHATSPVTFTSVTTNEQGTNQGCIFLGKAIQFGLGPTDNQLGVIPLVGNQYQADGVTAVTTLGQAIPRAAWPTGAEPTTLESLSPVDDLEYGLYVATYNGACGASASPEAVCYVPTSAPGSFVTTGMAAFLSGDSSGTIATYNQGNLQSGSQQLSLYGVAGNSQKGQDRATASASIGNLPPTVTNPAPGGVGMGYLVSASKVLICIASATTNQSGLFTISGDGSLSVTLSIKDNTTCS
jgi:type II secretory pathway pseudopilin PulG